MKKLIFIISVLLALTQNEKLFSQSDQLLDSGYYDLDSNVQMIEYFKHEIEGKLDTNRLSDTAYVQAISQFVCSKGAIIKKIYYEPEIAGIDILLPDSLDALDMIDVFMQTGLFVRVYPVIPLRLKSNPGDPNDFYYTYNSSNPNYQWYLHNGTGGIKAPRAWWITKGNGSKVRIYIIDTGLNLTSSGAKNHEDLMGSNIILGTNFLNGRNVSVRDSSGHGTAVAGLIGATRNNIKGIAGLDSSIDIVIHKVLKNELTVLVNDSLAKAINNAVIWKQNNPSKGCVINLSLSGLGTSNSIEQQVLAARNAGVIIICAAGNSGTQPVEYPGRYSSTYNNVVCVGASDKSDNRATYSNFSPNNSTYQLTLVAPGGKGSGFAISENMIAPWVSLSSSSQSIYNPNLWGTSYSTPLVSATVALMLSVKSTLTPVEIRSRLIRGCDKVGGVTYTNGYNQYMGYGRLNAYESVFLCLDSVYNFTASAGSSYIGFKRLYGPDNKINSNNILNIYSREPVVLTQGATFKCLGYSKLYIDFPGTNFITRTGATVSQSGEIVARFGGCWIQNGFLNLNFSNNGGDDRGCIALFHGGSMMIEDSISLNYNTGGFMAIWNGELITGNNSSINFGGESFLKVLGNSKLHFGENSGLAFTDNSYLYSGTYDTSVIQYAGFDENTLWNGIQISNSLNNDTNNLIRDCIFSQAKTAITIKNNQASAFVNRVIKNCTFNIPTGGDYKGIYGENNYSILVEGNRFNMPVPPPVDAPFYTGVYLKNVTPSSPPEAAGEEGATATPYSLNIVNNTLRNGSSGIVLANYTSNLLPYYIKGNRFDSLDAHAATVNIIGMKITGIIKDNVLSSSQSPIGIHLINSSPNLLNNILVARDVSLHLVGSSYANLAPNIYNNQAYWSGGRNTLSSYLYDNIQLACMGNAYTDYGRNKFTVSNDSAYHIYGWLDTNVLRYHSRDNCWYTSGAAKIYLRHPGATMPVLSTIYNRGIDCNSSPTPISWEVDNLGNGIFDSVLVSEDVSDSLPTEEEILIAQCEHYLNEMQMFGEAMISLKYYIDDYPEGEYTNDALMNLYTAYLYLDTSANQNNRNILFGNLINYCEDKVASNLYDTQFEYLAGDVIAMCNFELDNYDDAMNWYEFIALFYPDPDTRLTASWNYAEIEALIGSGTGGGEVELGIKNYELGMKRNHEKLELNRLFKAAQDDPVMRKLFRKFELQNKKMSGIDIEGTNVNKQHEVESEAQNSKLSEADMLISDKAKKNIFSAGTLQGKEAESDRMRDIVLMLPGARSLGKIVPSNVLPAEFALRQNYPNPFNPVTNIEYDLPVDGNIELKIYDIAGRLIKTLVNEFKTAGSYLVSFNASDLSSGVYFYSMNIDGKQIGVKRMTLVK